MKESYLAECLSRFHELPTELQELVGGFDTCLIIKKIEDAYGISLSFAVILVVIGELNVDELVDYLNLKFKLDKVKAQEITDKLDEEVFTPALELLNQNNFFEEDDSDEDDEEDETSSILNLSAEDRDELILNTFSDGVIDLLSSKTTEIQEFNISVFQAFNENEILEDKVESLLYNNQEKTGTHHIILDGHPASPSISNWLKDFIKKYGSDLFNDVTLIEYLTQSINIKNLNATEKELIRKILKLYRNLVFFPESMENIPLDHWEIFPIDRKEVAVKEDLLSDKPVVPKIVETPIISERQKIIFDLQKSLARYTPTSLEYKAIHQEINRLSHK